MSSTITLEMTVNEVVLRLPGALPVLAACGIDTCCGGALPLGEAARRHDVDADKLLARLLREAAGAQLSV